MSLNVIFRQRLDNVNNILNDPTRVWNEQEIMECLKYELFDIIEDNDNPYSRMIKKMQTHKIEDGNFSSVIDEYIGMDNEFKDNMKYSLEVFIKISKLLGTEEVYEEQNKWLEELNKL
jgi:hypothetical protein